jgi:hypothetical protein
MVCILDSQILSQVPDSQPIADSQVSLSDAEKGHVASLVAKVLAEGAGMMTGTKNMNRKDQNDMEKAMGVVQKGAMKSPPPPPPHVQLCVGEDVRVDQEFKNDVWIDKGFKEVHLSHVDKAILEHCDLSGARRCLESKCILMDELVQVCNYHEVVHTNPSSDDDLAVCG